MNVKINQFLSKPGIKIGHVNIYHLLGKLPELSLILCNQFHIFGVTESRLTDKITDSEITLKGFQVIRKDAVRKLETGIAVYVSNSLKYSRRSDLEVDTPESVWLEVKPLNKQSFLVCFIYRNPCAGNNWYVDFTTMMDKAFTSGKEILLLGDFNIDLNKSNPVWNDIILSYNFHQLINRRQK